MMCEPEDGSRSEVRGSRNSEPQPSAFSLRPSPRVKASHAPSNVFTAVSWPGPFRNSAIFHCNQKNLCESATLNAKSLYSFFTESVDEKNHNPHEKLQLIDNVL